MDYRLRNPEDKTIILIETDKYQTIVLEDALSTSHLLNRAGAIEPDTQVWLWKDGIIERASIAGSIVYTDDTGSLWNIKIIGRNYEREVIGFWKNNLGSLRDDE